MRIIQHRPLRRLVGAGLAGLLLAGCAGVPRILSDQSRTQPIETFYNEYAVLRDLRLIVSGGVTAIDKAALDRRSETVLSGGGQLQPVPRVRMTPDQSSARSASLRLAYMPSRQISGQALCFGETEGITPATGPHVWAVLAFCVGGKAISEATGDVDVTGLDDPALTSLLRSLALYVFRPDEIQGGSGTQSTQ